MFSLILLVIACLLFFAIAFGWLRSDRLHLTALGLAFWVLAEIIAGYSGIR